MTGVITVSIDGVLVPAEDASISVFDRGLLYGDGLFEVLRTWGGVAVELPAHLDRLYASAEVLQLQMIERARLEDAINRTIGSANTTSDQRIRILVTRGPGSLAQPFAELGRGRAIVIVEPLPPPPSELSLAVVDWPIVRGGHKTLAYLDPLIARELARAVGADEAIRLDPDGHVIEGATSNIFMVEQGAIATPRLDGGALPGIVRARILKLCAAQGIAASERVISVSQLHAADEVFVTSSLRGVVSVTRIDGASRAGGPITKTIQAAYQRAMQPAP